VEYGFVQPETCILMSLDQNLKHQLDAKKTDSAKLADWTPQIIIRYCKNRKKVTRKRWNGVHILFPNYKLH